MTAPTTAAELGQEHVGRAHPMIDPTLPFANGVLAAVEPTDGIYLRLVIQHSGHGHEFPVTAFARPSCPVTLS